MEPTYSIVIPAYNENRRIAASLDQVLAFLEAENWDAEVIVVNDGSRDNTAEIVRGYAQRHPAVRLVENPGNRGKGYSVRNGMLHAGGAFVLFSDADLSAPIAEAEKLIAALRAGADVAFGSRWARRELQVIAQPFYRRVLGRIFNLMLRVLLGLPYKDTQCGFKAFTRAAAQAVFLRQTRERWGFDPEILYIARRQGLKVVEVPVEWSHAGYSQLHPFRDGLRMFRDILCVRWNAWMGRYRGAAPLPGTKTAP